MRYGLVGFLVLVGAGAAFAQQPSPPQNEVQLSVRLAPLDKPGCKDERSPLITAGVDAAAERIKFGDLPGARTRLDELTPQAKTLSDRTMLAMLEVMYGAATKDMSRVASAINPLFATGCFPEDQVAQMNTTIAAINANRVSFQLTALDKPGCRDKTSPAVQEGLGRAMQLLKANDIAAARAQIDNVTAQATTFGDRGPLAMAELSFGMASKDTSRVLPAMEGVLASGCYAEPEVENARAIITAMVKRADAAR